MKPSSVLRLAVPWGLLLLTGAGARADAINTTPINWGYSWTGGIQDSSGKVSLGVPVSGNLTGPGNFGLSVPLNVSSTDSSSTKIDDRYSLVLSINDNSSSLPGAVTFTGSLLGSVSSGSSSLHAVPDIPVTQQLHLGHDLYNVTFAGFVPPTNGNKTAGEFLFDVRVHHNPEPASLALAGLCLPGLGLTLWRKRRLAATTPVL
jgi:hypothetical protein